MDYTHKITDEENGVEIRVAKIDSGYSVTMWDTDCGMALPFANIYKTEKAAVAAAEKMATDSTVNVAI